MADKDLQDGITLGIALLGAALGVINTCWAIWRDRARIKVVPLWIRTVGELNNGQQMRATSKYKSGLVANPDGQFAIRVVNRGFFDVTIENVGFTTSGSIKRHLWKSRFLRRAFAGDADEQVRLPRRLAPRESITVVCRYAGAELDAELRGATRIYASTSCGLDVFGTSRLLKTLCNEAARIR